MGLLFVLGSAAVGGPAAAARPIVLRARSGVEAVFEARGGRYRWSAYRDPAAGRSWTIAGPLFSLQTEDDGFRANLADVGFTVPADAPPTAHAVTLEATLARPAVEVRQVFAFCKDGRTLRVSTSLRATGDYVVIQRVGLLEIRVPGQKLERIGPEPISCPIIGDRIYAGVEHPSALCQVDGDTMYLAQDSYTVVGPGWVEVPAAIFGAASQADMAAGARIARAEAATGASGRADAARVAGIKRAFLRYLNCIRVKPRDMHLHYNNWWTMPVPYSERDVLDNIATLKRGLYDTTGLFFDSYAMDMGWSDPHSVWEVDRKDFPDGFRHICAALAKMHCHLGLWVSPSSLYPPALDNKWLEQQGYEVCRRPDGSLFACMALGGKYQRAFKRAVLRHAREAHLGQVKFDGLAWPCTAFDHDHCPGLDSYLPIANGLADVFDALRRQNPNIALEPTCLGYYPSPWWLMHTPYVIGPFGDDCPRGRCPAPSWIESLTTARDIANISGQRAFWMPSSALECFDIVVQCPGNMRNHAVMAIARGHWFESCYINPRFMDRSEWRFFADLMRWARAHREVLQNPVIFGGDPAKRQAYGYAYVEGERNYYFVRNPWMEEATVTLPEPEALRARELRSLYPCREVVARTTAGEKLPAVRLGPYETLVLEATPAAASAAGEEPERAAEPAEAPAQWSPTSAPTFERLTYSSDPPAYGPSWTSPVGDIDRATVLTGAGSLKLDEPAELCLLAETAPEVGPATCAVTLDGKPAALRQTGSRGAFYAAQAKPEGEWQWFLASVPAGRHEVSYTVTLPEGAAHAGRGARCGVYVRGLTPASQEARPPVDGPTFPLPAVAGHPWSLTLAPEAAPGEARVVEREVKRPIVRIDGIYLDTLPWVSATAGWGTVHRNASVMGNPMTIAGRVYHRGIGTHAVSRIVYDLPGGYDRFAATVGCDQEVHSNSIVFVVEGDGRVLFRSPLMHYDGPPAEVSVPIRGVKRLTLIVEDGGDGIGADHADWADARLLRVPGK